MSIFLQILYTILVLGFLILIHEFGHFITAKAFKVQINEFSIGMGPKLISVKNKKISHVFSRKKEEDEEDTHTMYSLRLFPIGGYVAMEGEDDESDCENAFGKKPAWQRLIITLAGAAMNLIVAILITLIVTMSTPTPSTTISSFRDDSVSNHYGLLEKDTIIKIGNTKISTFSDVSRAFQDQIGKQQVDVTVKRDGKEVELKDVKFPLMNADGKPATAEDIENGALVMFNLDFVVYAKEKTVWNVIKTTFQETVSQVKIMYETVADLITNKISVKYVSGPIGTSTVIKQAADYGIISLLSLTGFISVNLAVINLLPLPALDGGRSVFLLIETVFKKKVPAKIEAAIHSTGLILLMGLMLIIAIKDVIFLR